MGVTGSPWDTRLREMHWPEEVSEPLIHLAVLRNASEPFSYGKFQDVTATVPLAIRHPRGPGEEVAF